MRKKSMNSALVRKISELAMSPVRPLVRFILRHWIRHEELIRVRQQIRYLHYSELLRRRTSPPLDLTLFEMSIFSQNGEDGVVAEIFNRIGVTGRFFVEVGAAVNESNTQVLSDLEGWGGVYIDASDSEAGGLQEKYAVLDRITVKNTLVSDCNLDDLLLDLCVPSEIDLLSIDVDGNDYWIWKSLKNYRPRVVIIEFNSHIPPHVRSVQPYDPKSAWDKSNSFGSSLGACIDLATEKGYKLVHVESSGINAFFLRDDLSSEGFLPSDELVARAPNYFLYGLRHPDPKNRIGDSEGDIW
jgi:hypothetical protein